MSEIAKRIDALIAANLAPALRDLGFKKRGRNFRRRTSEATQVINIQASTSNNGDEGRLTVNLGLYFPAIARFTGRFEEIDEPSEPDCPLRERIGALMPERQDLWWSVSSSTSIDALSVRIAEACMQYGIPWLDGSSTVKSALAYRHRKAGPIVMAAMHLADGDRAAAVALMTEALRNDVAVGGWFAFAVAAGLESEFRVARGDKKAGA